MTRFVNLTVMQLAGPIFSEAYARLGWRRLISARAY
jgi:hypothetical protein